MTTTMTKRNCKNCELSPEFIKELNNSNPEKRLSLVEFFLTECALTDTDPQFIIDSTFCGDYKKSFIKMVNIALCLVK